MRVTLIHNPGAGAGTTPADELTDALRAHGYEPAYQSSDEPDWERALDEPGEMIVVAGGDGIVARLCKKLAARPGAAGVPVAVIPLGTANNIATTLGVVAAGGAGWDVRGMVAGWRGARRQPLDVGVAAAPGVTSPFVESVGCGLFAEMMSRFARKKHSKDAGENHPDEELRKARAELRRMLRDMNPRAWRVELDGRDHAGRYLLVEAMNIRQIGPGFELAPGADVGDGQLDVVFVCDADDDRARLDAHLREHPADDPTPPLLTVRRAREVVIDGRGECFHLDDKLWPKDDDHAGDPRGPLRLRLRQGALTMVVPAP